ncbi:MAG: general secretion pathway protein GspF, partial [Desulfobacteraceae bacterium IS3]
GVQILESFRIIANAIGNKAVSREFDRIREQIEKGSSISGPLKAAKYFTPMVVNMIAIGEKTEKLDEMLSDVAQHYDAEVEYAMKTLSEYIGPVLTICMAAIVGFFALAIMMPMWDLAQIPK